MGGKEEEFFKINWTHNIMCAVSYILEFQIRTMDVQSSSLFEISWEQTFCLKYPIKNMKILWFIKMHILIDDEDFPYAFTLFSWFLLRNSLFFDLMYFSHFRFDIKDL